MKQKTRCYIYTRVSTPIVRVDGISLDKEQSDEHTVTLEKFPTLETVCLLSRKYN